MPEEMTGGKQDMFGSAAADVDKQTDAALLLGIDDCEADLDDNERVEVSSKSVVGSDGSRVEHKWLKGNSQVNFAGVEQTCPVAVKKTLLLTARFSMAVCSRCRYMLLDVLLVSVSESSARLGGFVQCARVSGLVQLYSHALASRHNRLHSLMCSGSCAHQACIPTTTIQL